MYIYIYIYIYLCIPIMYAFNCIWMCERLGVRTFWTTSRWSWQPFSQCNCLYDLAWESVRVIVCNVYLYAQQIGTCTTCALQGVQYHERKAAGKRKQYLNQPKTQTTHICNVSAIFELLTVLWILQTWILCDLYRKKIASDASFWHFLHTLL